MQRLIDAKEAVIYTASIEIKTLTIRGKQVTLSVFRQLPEKDFLDSETGCPNGAAWGTVNYYWGNLDRDCLHVVWQRGERLYRSLVLPTFLITSRMYLALQRADRLVSVAGNLDLAGKIIRGEAIEWDEQCHLARAGNEKTWALLARHGHSYDFRMHPLVESAWQRSETDYYKRARQNKYESNTAYPETDEEFAARIRTMDDGIKADLRSVRDEAIQELAEAGCPSGSSIEALSWAIECRQQVLDQNKQAKDRWKKEVENIRQLDQLFIAV